jgi:hypothetical protein
MNNRLDRKSVSGGIIIFNKKQKTVLILNIKAEYIVFILIIK